MCCRLYFFLLASLGWQSISAAELRLDAGLGYRYFDSYQGSDPYRYAYKLSSELELNTQYRGFSFAGRVYGSWDSEDEDRQYIDTRQASVTYQNGKLSVAGGVGTFFWGVSETINILNVANQSDLRESIDGKAKMGQTFYSLAWDNASSTFSIYHFPDFEPLAFPERPTTLIPVDQANTLYEAKNRGDSAVRWHFSGNSGEAAVTYFDGTRRDPLLVNTSSPGTLSPLYLQTEFLALESVLFAGDLQFKTEAKWGKERAERYSASNLGIEYPTYPKLLSLNSLALIAEYLYDSRGLEAETLGQNDLFLGVRVNFGQLGQFDLRAVTGIDLEYDSVYIDISYKQRMTDYIRCEARLVSFGDVGAEDMRLRLLEDEDFIEFALHFAI